MNALNFVSNGALVVPLQADEVGVPTFADCCWRSALVYLFLLDHRLSNLYRLFLHRPFKSCEAYICVLHDLNDETSGSVGYLMALTDQWHLEPTATMAGGTISMMS